MCKLLSVSISFILLSFFSFSGYAQQNRELIDNINTILKSKKATVGVAVIFDGKDTLVINNQYRYPTMSVYKFYQALAVMDYLDKRKLSLDTKVHVKKTDLLPDTHSPLRDSIPAGNFMITVGDLIKYSISKSDNNACDILFKYIGGTKTANEYIKRLGIKDVEIAATEAKMHETIENQYLNWSAPSSAVELLEIFLKKDILSKENQSFLETAMINTTTGANKIKALLPSDKAVVGHKTGSAFRNEFGIMVAENDMGFVRLPGGKQYTIAVFVMNSREDDKTNCSIIAEISKAVYDFYAGK